MTPDVRRLSPFQQQLLKDGLQKIFGNLDEALFLRLADAFDWVRLHGGETLMKQGDPGDDLYFVISGRLRAYLESEGEETVFFGEIARGEAIGEMNFFTGEARSATVVAVRDSVLIRLSRSAFDQVLAVFPHVSMNLARLVIGRLRSSAKTRAGLRRPVNICLLPVSANVDTVALARDLVAELGRDARVKLIDRAAVRALAGGDNTSFIERNEEDYHRLASALDMLETEHDFLVFVADDAISAGWQQRCLRIADEILLLANANEPPRPAPPAVAAEPLSGTATPATAHQVLVLLHDRDTAMPANTRAWLDRHPVSAHLHVRPALRADVARLARFENRTAVGLVLAGGGARGFAHLGVFKALHEAGIAIDLVGGTSMGAVMAALIASGRGPDEIIAIARRAFARNPTSDWNFLPLLSLIKGEKLRRTINQAVEDCFGHDLDIEDCWKNFFCVATNYSRAREQVFTRGSLATGVRASVSIPGILPPVIHDDELLLDGGVFNNFPADVMAAHGAGKIIGVDLYQDQATTLGVEDIPGPWALFRDRFKRAGRRRFRRLPSLAATLMRTTVIGSTARRHASRALADICFHPDMRGVSILQWKAFDRAVELGYRHARQVLAEMGESALAAYRHPDCLDPPGPAGHADTDERNG